MAAIDIRAVFWNNRVIIGVKRETRWRIITPEIALVLRRQPGYQKGPCQAFYVQVKSTYKILVEKASQDGSIEIWFTPVKIREPKTV